MKNFGKNKTFAILLLIIALVFGSFQERIKLNLNNIISYSVQISEYDSLSNEVREEYVDQIIASKPIDFFSSNKSFSHFFNYNRSELNRVKWILAFVFIFVFFVFNAGILYLWYKDMQLIKFLALAYIFLCLVSIGFFGLGYLSSNVSSGYGVARKILGALQSLIPVMILFPTYLIFDISKQTADEQ